MMSVMVSSLQSGMDYLDLGLSSTTDFQTLTENLAFHSVYPYFPNAAHRPTVTALQFSLLMSCALHVLVYIKLQCVSKKCPKFDRL